jgi:hypothetical protein
MENVCVKESRDLCVIQTRKNYKCSLDGKGKPHLTSWSSFMTFLVPMYQVDF